MLSKWMIPALGLASCAMVGAASAAEPAHASQSAKPTVLSLAQMDNVTAGSVFAIGNNLQVLRITQVGVAVGGDNQVNQGVLAINYYNSYPFVY